MINRITPLLSNCLALFAIYYFLMPAPAYGYFDLGTGTYMVQMLLGFGAALWLSLRTSWIRFDRKKKTPAGGAAANNSASLDVDDAAKAEPGPSEPLKNESQA